MSLASLVNSASAVYGLANTAIRLAGGKGLGSSRGYYPSAWGHSMAKDKMLLMVPNVGGIFFDAILTYDEDNSMTFTSHPVQMGANITDYGYKNPVMVSMDVACSNAMACRQPGGAYKFNSGDKAQDVVNTVLDLMYSKQPLKVIGLRSVLENMVIESVLRHEDATTNQTVRMTINLRQLLMAEVSVEKSSSRNWSTAGPSKGGEVSGQQEENSSTLRKIEDMGGK